MNLEEYEQTHPAMNVVFPTGAKLVFNVPNRDVAWRVNTMFTKEPDTIAWIESLPAGDVFLDVGANIGLYSLYAAHRGLTVYAFEPEAQNYALLVKNIVTNNLNVSAYPVALSDRQAWDYLYLSSLKAGGSCHNFGESVNFHQQPQTFPYKQGCFSTTIDQLPFQPDHIKIDVDGIEEKVIAGARIKMQHVKSVLVEINHNVPAHVALVEQIKNLGYRTDEKQVEDAKRKEGPFANIGNVIFLK